MAPLPFHIVTIVDGSNDIALQEANSNQRYTFGLTMNNE